MITAIILSAGASSRMGDVKALLKYGEKTFIRNIVDNIKSAGVNEIFAVTGFNKEKIEPLIKDIKMVENPNPDEGQFSSLKTGIANISTETTSVLVQLVDVPGVKPETYKAVIDAHKNNPEKIIIPYYKDKDERGGAVNHAVHGGAVNHAVHGHPVVFPKKFFKGLLDYPVSKTARDFIREQSKDDIFKIEVNDPGILKDFDTPKDLL